jgi:phospholipid transport system transporter-binding protein
MPTTSTNANTISQFTVPNPLNFDTTPALYTRGCELIDNNPQPIFDMQQVTESDNSGLALMTSWVSYAKKYGKNIQFINMTPKLLEIAKISNLQDILPIK